MEAALKQTSGMEWTEMKELFEKFLDDIYTEDGDLKENIDEKLYKQADNEISSFWKDKSYNPMDVMNLMLISELVQEADLKYVTYIFDMCNIKITPKDRKKGKRAILGRMFKKYHKEHVRNTLNGILETFCRKEIQVLKTIREEENMLEVFDDLVDKMGVMGVLWPIEKIIKDEELKGILSKHYPIRYVASLAQLALFYMEVDYPTIMESPEDLDKNNPNQTLNKIKQEQKTMQKKLVKKEKETSTLKKEVHSLQQEKKKLASEVHELYRNALQEIEQLKQEKDEAEEYYLSVIEGLSNQLLEMQQDLLSDNADEKVKISKFSGYDLKGKTIAVIGGSKERHFREIIESHNGKMTFAAEDNFLKIDGAIRKADVVFYLTELVGHHFYREAYPLAKKYNIPFVFYNSKGTSSFELELKRFAN